MKRQQHINELNDIQELLNKVKTLNESILYNEDYEGYEDEMIEPEMNAEMTQDDEEGVEMGSEMEHVGTEEEGMAQLDEMGAIDQIREITLKGMTKLCKTPEDAQYQALKKIFQMCDKAVDTEAKEQQQVK